MKNRLFEVHITLWYMLSYFYYYYWVLRVISGETDTDEIINSYNKRQT